MVLSVLPRLECFLYHVRGVFSYNIFKYLLSPFSLFSTFENESESRSVMSNSLRPHGLYIPWNSPGQNTGVFPFTRGIFPTQGLNPGLPHCRQILYQLSYQGSPIIPRSPIIPSRSPSGTPINAGPFNTVTEVSEIVFDSFHSLLCSVAVSSTTLSFSSLIHSSASVILLLIPSSIFFHFSYYIVHLCSFLKSSNSLLNFVPPSFLLVKESTALVNKGH